MIVHLQITHDDIKRGIALSCYDCPAACALRRATKAEHVQANYVSLIWVVADVTYRCETPYHLAQFMRSFDQRSFDIEPCDFVISGQALSR